MKKEMHVVLPTTTQGLSDLCKSVKTKVDADGITGECVGMISTQSINMGTDLTGTLDALAHERESGRLFRLGEENNAAADKDLAFIKNVVREIGRELTSLYKPDRTHKIAYGFDLSPTGATKFPTTDDGWKLLFNSINTQYLSVPPGTADIEPFLVRRGWVMATLKIALDAAIAKKLVAAQNHRDSVTETQERNADMATPEINIHKFMDFLHGRHPDDARALGAYGFTTSAAATKEVDQLSNAPIEGQRIIQHIVFDSILVNMTADPIIVNKGRRIRGEGTTIPGFGQMAMTKGYSNVIIRGTNPLKEGLVKTRVAR